jgi:hypothetical protein
MMLYIDEPGLAGLLQQAEGRSLVETNASVSREHGESLKGGVDAGGGFLAVLGLAKLSLGFGKTKKKGMTDAAKFVVGPHAYLGRIINQLRKHDGTRYFESLDDAFASAPEEGSSWVCVKDVFALTNVDQSLSFEALNREQRFLFEIDPARGGHTDRDDYYKKPPRKWHLSMAASFERCPRLKGRSFGVSSHEALYFRNHGYSSIPLHVFGCYLKTGLRAQIIPYAIWI